MKKKLLILLLFSLFTSVYGQCGPPCQLNGVGVHIWLGDADSQTLGDLSNDDEDDDDFIAFKNYSSQPVNISGWQLYVDQNGAGAPVFTFPSGTVLQPGQYTLVVADWNPGPALPLLWFDANFASGEGMFEETTHNKAWAILKNPAANQYITIHQQGSTSHGQSLSSGTKICDTNVADLIPDDFDGCEAVYFNQNTCMMHEITDCSLPMFNSACGQISNTSPPLSSSSVNFSCPATGYNLNGLHTGTVPSGSVIVWYTNSTHTGSAYSTPAAAQPGTYYAFYYNSAANCYSAASTAVTVTESQAKVPVLNTTTLRNTCPAMTANLNSLLIETPPAGMTLVWFTNSTHTGSPVSNPSAVGAGTYYPFYYSLSGNCYSQPGSVVTVSVTDDCYCTKLPAAGQPDSYTIIGITSQTKKSEWPDTVPNGFIAMESKSKGFVITRVTGHTAVKDPKEGMLIYDIAASCVKIYNGTIWKCIQRRCND
ncbi:lamin tail domain-containing protein [Chryseobacterium sp. L7]|uniref:Lamin tail domain-containing protein n=1 Tax=Chryseobacterium endalhagicum TaxID=2797638 RepID=A0ABS1QEZ5_9FLAO|nr:lamin tail domain-containing protein [Chryseobacterium endalhagicum]MBL1221170.1 lamin tail domain-containing protein [Chryseobacterium endalhagicum]